MCVCVCAHARACVRVCENQSYSKHIHKLLYNNLNLNFYSLVKSGSLLTLKPPLGKQVDRVIMCVGLSVGAGLQITLYLTELAARSKCGASSSLFEGMWTFECYRRFNN